MITQRDVVAATGSFTGTVGAGLVTFADLQLQSLDFVPVINLVAFTTTDLVNFRLELNHPLGAVSGRVILLDETPTALSPGGFGGFTQAGCDIVVPRGDTAAGTPWQLKLFTPVLATGGEFIVSYSAVAKVSGRG